MNLSFKYKVQRNRFKETDSKKQIQRNRFKETDSKKYKIQSDIN